jgi:ankyrin repeat protein
LAVGACRIVVEATHDPSKRHILFRLIADDKVNLNTEDSFGRTPLFEAIRLDELEAVRFLLESKKVDVNHKCDDGVTPLLLALSEGRIKIVEMLLDIGNANPNIEANDNLREIIANPEVKEVVPFLESRGGSVSGLEKAEILLDIGNAEPNVEADDALRESIAKLEVKEAVQFLGGSVSGLEMANTADP